MEIAYQTSEEDEQAYQKLHFPRPAWKYWLIQFGWFLFAVGPATAPFYLRSEAFWGNNLLIVYTIYWSLGFLLQKRQAAKPHEDPRLLEVRLSADGFASRDDHASTWIAWDLFECAESLPCGVQLRLTGKRSVLIPPRAFANEAEQAQFAQLAERLRSTATDAAANEFPDSEHSYIPDWSNSPSASIDYQIDADEYSYFVYNGLVAHKRRNIYVGLFLMSILLLAAAGFMLSGMIASSSADIVENKTRDRMMRMAIASLVWFSAARAWSGLFCRWIYRFYLVEPLLSPTRLTIWPQGFAQQSALATRYTDWNNLSQVEQNQEFLAFRNREGAAICIVPKRAFPTPQLADDFANQAYQYWQIVQTRDQSNLADDDNSY